MSKDYFKCTLCFCISLGQSCYLRLVFVISPEARNGSCLCFAHRLIPKDKKETNLTPIALNISNTVFSQGFTINDSFPPKVIFAVLW